jgi:hypothetical protein
MDGWIYIYIDIDRKDVFPCLDGDNWAYLACGARGTAAYGMRDIRPGEARSRFFPTVWVTGRTTVRA